jgi:hypothetical protein
MVAILVVRIDAKEPITDKDPQVEDVDITVRLKIVIQAEALE